MKRSIVITALSVVLGASGLHAQASYKRDVPDALVKRAKITEQAAAAMAQKRVPTGTIQGVELEQEKGRLIYSYELKVPGKSGLEEVNIDAMDGKVVAVEHESAAAEQKEVKAERKEATKAKSKK